MHACSMHQGAPCTCTCFCPPVVLQLCDARRVLMDELMATAKLLPLSGAITRRNVLAYIELLNALCGKLTRIKEGQRAEQPAAPQALAGAAGEAEQGRGQQRSPAAMQPAEGGLEPSGGQDQGRDGGGASADRSPTALA